MKRLTFVLLLLSLPALADGIKTPGIDFHWGGGSGGTWALEAGPIYNPTNNPGYHFFPGTFTSFSEQITCVVTGCGKVQGNIPFQINMTVSGFTLNDVDIKGTLYQTVYVEGSLNIFTSAIYYPVRGGFNFADSRLSGSFLACADPSCSVELFPFSLNYSTAHPGLFGASFVNGKPVISSLDITITPEPSDFILMGTGVALLPLLRRPRVLLSAIRHLKTVA